MNSKINIEKIDITQLDELQKVSRLTFFQAFSSQNTEEDMNDYLDQSFSSDQLTREVNNPESEFYFAKSENQVIGYLKLNFGQSQSQDNGQNGIEIERIYVMQQYQGNKVGQLLYNKAVEVAKRKNATYIWLGVWEENPGAIRFYKKNGFIEYDKRIFKLGSDEQTDIMMKLIL